MGGGAKLVLDGGDLPPPNSYDRKFNVGGVIFAPRIFFIIKVKLLIKDAPPPRAEGVPRDIRGGTLCVCSSGDPPTRRYIMPTYRVSFL